MPLPGSTLRAPLLWLLLPGMAGMAAGACWACPDSWLPGLTGAAGLLALAAGRVAERAEWLWASALVLAAGLGGYALERSRQTGGTGAGFAPRETSLVLEIDRLYASDAGRKTQTGLARIVGEGDGPETLPGTRLYFSVVRRGSLPLVRSGRYAVRGVLQPLSEEREPAGLSATLREMGVGVTLTRAQVRRELAPPGWWARWANAGRTRLDGLLALGVEKYPAELALYRGMMLGEKAVLSTDQQELFTHSGTFHIFVIAGLHIGVIAAAIHSLLGLLRVPHRAALLLGLALLAAYVAVTGAGLPARRALVMIGLFTGAKVFRLPANPLALLTAAAALVLLLEPAELFSTGFEMSFAVVAGLICVGAPLAQVWQAAWQPWSWLPPADQAWWQKGVTFLGHKILGGLAISGVALIASAVPIIGSFGIFAPVSLLANLAVVPLAMLTLSAGCAALVAGLAQAAPLASLFNHAAILLIRLMTHLVRLGSALPGACFPAHFRRPEYAGPALALVVAALLLAGARRWPRRAGAFWWPVAALAGVLILGVKFG